MPSVDWQLSFCPTITGVCTPACLLAASISVEAVTPPLVGLAILKELLPDYGSPRWKSNAAYPKLDAEGQCTGAEVVSTIRPFHAFSGRPGFTATWLPVSLSPPSTPCPR